MAETVPTQATGPWALSVSGIIDPDQLKTCLMSMTSKDLGQQAQSLHLSVFIQKM